MDITDKESSRKRTAVLIHGMWMTPLCWEFIGPRLEQLGYRVTAPGWPGHEGDVEEVRKAAPSALAGLGFAEITSHFENMVRDMEEQPVLIGHSFGGLVAQVLLDRGLGAAGVAIDSAPPEGVNRIPYAQLKSAFPVLSRPGNRHKAVALTFKQFWYSFANTLVEEEARSAYERYAVPDTGRPIFQAALANFMREAPTAVNYRNNDRKPLLLIAGADDHTVPASVTRSNFKKYRHSSAVTDLQQFAGRSHLIIASRGWEEVVDAIDEWLTNTLEPGAKTEIPVEASLPVR